MNEQKDIEAYGNNMSLSERSLLEYDNFNKPDKISAAIYLVTSLIEDKEPLKWKLRGLALKIMSFSTRQGGKKLQAVLTETGRFVSLAENNYLMSHMNATVLLDEVSKTKSDLSKKNLLPGGFFNEINIKGIKDIKDKNIPSIKKDKVFNQKRQDNRKNKRKELIREALSEGKEMGIKDISKVVKGCSEKTIQRELYTLIEEGSVMKKGERRWSRYSVVI